MCADTTEKEVSDNEKSKNNTEPKSLLDSSGADATDYDDIPVSKIPKEKPLENKEENDDKKDGEDSIVDSATPGTGTKKKKRGRDSTTPSSSKRRSSLGKFGKKRKNRGRIVPESDGEADDLIETPPPSPPPDSELDSLKRRSARNTQRKKYTDDVLLRLSDDEIDSMLVASANNRKKKKEKEKDESATTSAPASNVNSDTEKVQVENNTSVEAPDNPDVSVSTAASTTSETAVSSERYYSAENIDEKSEKNVETSKPNYVYVNTGDEDSMVVQYVLAVRIGKRELKSEPIPSPKIQGEKKPADTNEAETEQDIIEGKSESEGDKSVQNESIVDICEKVESNKINDKKTNIDSEKANQNKKKR